MHALRLVLLVLFALHCAAVGAVPALFSHEAVDLAQEAALAARQGKRLAVLFKRDDCSFCAQMERSVFPARQSIKEFGQYFHTVAVRTDRETKLIAPDGTQTTPAALATRFRLTGAPAFAFFDRRGSLETRHQGAFSDAAGLIALGRYVHEGAFESLPFATWRASTNGRDGKQTASLQDQSGGSDDLCSTSPTAHAH